MKRKLLCSSLVGFALIAVLGSQSANADTTASQTITGTLNPFVKVTNAEGTSTSVSINEDGSLSTNLAPSFKFTSNNKNGATASFNIKVSTADGNQTDAIFGANNSATGRIVLGNAVNLPNAGAVRDALGDSPTAGNNPNVISYGVTFNTDNTANGNIPVFGSNGNTVSGNVLTKNGANSVTITVDKNSVRSGTFSEDDQSGSYSATIFCTSAIL